MCAALRTSVSSALSTASSSRIPFGSSAVSSLTSKPLCSPDTSPVAADMAKISAIHSAHTAQDAFLFPLCVILIPCFAFPLR